MSAQEEEAMAPPADARALRVLVVEDEADSARSLAMLLRLFGHQVEVAPDGASALEAARARPPDVVLLDIRLPGPDGWEVARRIRGWDAPTRPLLVAVTGYGSEEDLRRSEEAGIDLHLTKPAEPDQLRWLLARFGDLVD